MSLSYLKDPLIHGIVGLTAFFTAIQIGWLLTGGEQVTLSHEYRTYVAVITIPPTTIILCLGSFLALGRHKVLGDATSFWIGVAFASFAVALVFRALLFPFLPGAKSLIGHSPGSSAWINLLASSTFGSCLLAAILDSSPAHESTLWRRRLALAALWPVSVAIVSTGFVIFGKHLPVLVTATGTFTPLLSLWQCCNIAILFAGAVLATRRYALERDVLPGWVAFTQVTLAFGHLGTAAGGNRLTLMSVIAPFVAMSGYLVMVFGLLSDYVQLLTREGQLIRALDRQVKELQRTEAALRRSNGDLQQFAYVASHDLREPLRNISTYASLLALSYQRGELSKHGDRCIGIINSGVKRMEALITDLLSYSRVTSDSSKPLEKVDMAAVLQEATANLQTAIAETSASITHDVLPTVHADRMQMVQVLQNLIGNSLTYRRNGVCLCIQISVKLTDKDWIFCVRDNGQGFRPEYADRIFGIFKRLHGNDVPGTGIGLSICKAIIDRHGGRIFAEGNLDQGAAFYFTLPQLR